MFTWTNMAVFPMQSLRVLLSQFKNRGRIGIVVDILDSVQRNHPRGRSKTQIMRAARLSYEQTCRYVDFLMLCDYVRGEKVHQGGRELVNYYLTPQGFELFKQLYTLHTATELLSQKSL